jgi:hypothetical protein
VPSKHSRRPTKSRPLFLNHSDRFRANRSALGLRPEEWPETMQAAEAFARATGRQRRLGDLARDEGLRALLTLYAQGYSVEDVAWVAGTVPRQRWWHEGRHALASLSPRVVARALKERQQVEPTTATRRGLPSKAAGPPPAPTPSRPRQPSAGANTAPALASAEFRPAAEALATILARIQEDFIALGPGVRAAATKKPASAERQDGLIKESRAEPECSTRFSHCF